MHKDLHGQERFTLFISNETMDDTIKIAESLEKSGLLIDDATETVKHELRKTKRWTSWGVMMALMVFSLINAINGQQVMRAGKRQVCGFLPLLALPLIL